MAIDTPEPSPFSHEILNANPYAYLDDAPLEERRARAVQMRRTLPRRLRRRRRRARPGRHRAGGRRRPGRPCATPKNCTRRLCGLSVLPRRASSRDPRELRSDGAAPEPPRTAPHASGLLDSPHGRARFWMAAERAAIWCAGSIAAPPSSRPLRAPAGGARRSRIARTLRGRNPARLVRVLRSAARLGLGARPRHAARSGGPGAGAIGSRRPDSARPFQRADRPAWSDAELEWCHRRLLARIHRLTIGRLRREIEPVTTAGFYAFLRRWQHLSAGGQLHGADGTLQIVKQLQGCEFPAAAWETEVLPRRVARYKPEYLDQLCLSGEVTWGRLSPHPAFEREGTRPAQPRAAHARGAAGHVSARGRAWLLAESADADAAEALSHPAREALAALEVEWRVLSSRT